MTLSIADRMAGMNQMNERKTGTFLISDGFVIYRFCTGSGILKKKYGNLQTSFPYLEKLWKIEIKSGKKWKQVWNFFSFYMYNKRFIIE